MKQKVGPMNNTIRIKDELSFNFNQVTTPYFTLDFRSGFVTPREIIRERVFSEVQNYNEMRPEFFYGLVQPAESERVLNGFRMRAKKEINPQNQYQKAIEAFEQNGFIMLVNDLQIETLDEQIEIEPDMEITFLKLVPLVGG
jgi:hypothetical protein